MCDILAISAGYKYTPQKYLPIFAEKGQQNMAGWGIGFFREDQTVVEKSSEKVFSHQQVHGSFQRLARVIDSRIIISHINCPQSGGRHSAQLHPFKLEFLDHHWLFAQVGVVEDVQNYLTFGTPRLEADVYTARIFEYLRDAIILFHGQNPYVSLYGALRMGIQNMLTEYPGDYAFFLSNESVLFAFCNYRQFKLLKEFEAMGDILMITSIEEGLSQKRWHTIIPEKRFQGKLFAIAGPDVLYVGDV